MLALFENWVDEDWILFIVFSILACVVSVLIWGLVCSENKFRDRVFLLGAVVVALVSTTIVAVIVNLIVDNNAEQQTQYANQVFAGEEFADIEQTDVNKSGVALRLDSCSFNADFNEWENGMLVLVTNLSVDGYNNTQSMGAAVPPNEAREFVLANCRAK